jgi:hypothetical protein
MKNISMIVTLVVIALYVAFIITTNFDFLLKQPNGLDGYNHTEASIVELESRLIRKIEQLEEAHRQIYNSVQYGLYFIDTQLASLLQNETVNSTYSTFKMNAKLNFIRKSFRERTKLIERNFLDL